MKRILIVDDERQIIRMLRASLQSKGYEVDAAANGHEALDRFDIQKPDLIITDLSMPLMDGLDLTRAIRRKSNTPILVLSVRDAEPMKISALDEGADDYLTKPFSMLELLARVRAQLRRAAEGATPGAVVESGALRLDPAKYSATFDSDPLHLTPKEFRLLQVLIERAGSVVTHNNLLKLIWGESSDAQLDNLRVLVAQLRKKLEHGHGHKLIQSEPWVGYRLVTEL